MCGAATAQLPGGGVRRAARLGGQAGEGRPEQPALAHGDRGDLLGRHPQVGGLRVAVEVEREVVRESRLFWATLTGLSAEPSRTAHATAWELRDRRPHTVIDLDYRPQFWRDPVGGHPGRRRRHRGEHRGHRQPRGVPSRGRPPTTQRTPPGPCSTAGCSWPWSSRVPRACSPCRATGERVVVPPVPIEVANGLGHGDAFGGALCHGLLEGWSLERTLRFANSAGAIVASRLECSTAMPEEPRGARRS